MDTFRFVVVAILAEVCNVLRKESEKHPAVNSVIDHLKDAQKAMLNAQDDVRGTITYRGTVFNNKADLAWTEIDILLGTKGDCINKIPAIKQLRHRRADPVTGNSYGLKEAKEQVEQFLGDNGYGQYAPHNGMWSEARQMWISPAIALK